MSATILGFQPPTRRKTLPQRSAVPTTLFGDYTPPPGARVVVAPQVSGDGSAVFDIEVVEHDGQDGFAVIASCGDLETAEHHARQFADRHGLRVAT